MIPALPTASGIERALACPASTVLPQTYGGGEDAERGSAIGKFARDIIAGEPYEVALDRVARKDWKATCSGLDFQAICGDLVHVRAEVAYGVQPDAMSARFLGLNLGRRYPTRGPGEFVGTNDLEGQTSDGVEVACDLKSGKEVTSCAANPQMQFHATARYLLTGKSPVEGRLLYVRSDGRVAKDPHTFTAFEMDSFADRLADLVGILRDTREAHAAGGLDAIKVTEGRHCAYCPAYSACPAKTRLARELVPTLRKYDRQGLDISPEDAGAAWAVATEGEKLAKAIKSRMNGYARQSPIHTRPGKVVREIASHTTEFAQGSALALLRELGATQAQIDLLFVETPTTQVREVNEVQRRRAG